MDGKWVARTEINLHRMVGTGNYVWGIKMDQSLWRKYHPECPKSHLWFLPFRSGISAKGTRRGVENARICSDLCHPALRSQGCNRESLTVPFTPSWLKNGWLYHPIWDSFAIEFVRRNGRILHPGKHCNPCSRPLSLSCYITFPLPMLISTELR